MARVTFTGHLQRFFPDLKTIEVEGETVAAIIAEVNRTHPGLASYLLDDRGALRQHVNVFVSGAMIHDRTTLQDAVAPGGEVFVTQALSGG